MLFNHAKLKKRDTKVKEASLKCLNLMHLKAIVKSIESLENVVAVSEYKI